MGYLTQSQAYDPTENTSEPTDSKLQKPLIKKQSCYYSDIVGECIKDAITGAKYPWRVGSVNEQRFFRVMCTTSFVDPTRKGMYDSYAGRSARKAFYEDPYAYMQHRKIELDEDIVKKWYDKMNELYPGQYTYIKGN